MIVVYISISSVVVLLARSLSPSSRLDQPWHRASLLYNPNPWLPNQGSLYNSCVLPYWILTPLFDGPIARDLWSDSAQCWVITHCMPSRLACIVRQLPHPLNKYGESQWIWLTPLNRLLARRYIRQFVCRFHIKLFKDPQTAESVFGGPPGIYQTGS